MIKGSNTKIQNQAARGRGGQRGKKNLECNLEGEPDKFDNVSNAKAYHAEKIRPRNQNIEYHERPHPYPQGMMMKHQRVVKC